MKNSSSGCAILLLVTLLTGCIFNSAEEPRTDLLLTHTVTYHGETLILISKWYTGKAANWTQIAKANPDLKAGRIKIGDEVNIPAQILIRKQPLPREFITSYWVRIHQIKKEKMNNSSIHTNIDKPLVEVDETFEVDEDNAETLVKDMDAEVEAAEPGQISTQEKQDELIEKLLQ